MTNYMLKSGLGTGSDQICFTNPAPVGFLESKSGTAYDKVVNRFYLQDSVLISRVKCVQFCPLLMSPVSYFVCYADSCRTMVMEPSPQCVGREFVKQYYTMLNQAPNFLHRYTFFPLLLVPGVYLYVSPTGCTQILESRHRI